MIQLSIGTLNDADLWALKQALANAQPPSVPAPVPALPSAGAPQYVVPPEVTGRRLLVTPMPWINGTRLLSGALDDSNAWVIPFTTGQFASGRFQGAEWLDPPVYRYYQILRNSDGAVIANPAPTTSPSVQFVAGDPGRFSGKVHLDSGTSYTLTVWNKTTVPSGRMLMELYFY